jgi:large subunit ribosomal protein L3
MAGHMGHDRITARHLKVVRVDAERNLLFIKGAVPGTKNGLVTVRKSTKQGVAPVKE